MYQIAQTPTVFVDHTALTLMVQRVEQAGTRAVLVGFGEYAKHLINLRPDNVVAVYDPREWLHGTRFRGVEVLPPTQKVAANLIIACEYEQAYGFMGDIVRLYGGAIEPFIPPVIHYKQTAEINVFEQEGVYAELYRDTREAPVSMMHPDKIKFLMEMLRLGLTFDGDVVEMGSWQGGSTWFMGRLLSILGEARTLFAMDLFETHMPDPTATMCTDEIGRRLHRAYPKTELVTGLCDAPEALARIPGQVCFAHIDLGPHPAALDFLWSRMPAGAPIVLDNYGHIAATWAFDDYFAAKGTRVTRLPWSEQGLVFKRA